jgi:trimeric autotransporter adhesin
MTTIRPRLASLLTAAAVSGALLAPSSVLAAGDPVALRFEVQPGGGPAGRPMAQQPVVRVVDADGNTVTTSTAAVTLKPYGNVNDVLVCQENPVRAINGVATFHGCYLFDGPQSGERVRATAYRLDGAISDPFDVGPRGAEPAVRLVFDVGNGFNVGPFTATAEGPLWFDLRVRVENPQAGTITSGPTSTLPITLAMAPNPEAAAVSCTDGLTVPAVAGIATFIGCSISKLGIALRLAASADGADPVWSFPINVWQPGSLRGPDVGLSDIVGSTITWGRPVEFMLHLSTSS